MNASPGWTRGRLVATGLVIFLAQVGAVWMFSGASSKATVRNPPGMQVRLIDKEVSAAPAMTDLLEDPTLSALPHPQGFSGRTWLVPEVLKFEYPSLSESPAWLKPQPAAFGADMAEYARTNTGPEFVTVTAPEPRYDVVDKPARPLGTQSVVRVVGISKDQVVSLPKAPSMPAQGALEDTVVDVHVNATGNVVTTRLVESLRPTGLERRAGGASAEQRAADLMGWQLAREAVFARRDQAGDALTTVRLIFQWHTRPIPTEK